MKAARHIPAISLYISVAFLLQISEVFAQCSVSLGNNLSICQGSSATLTASTSGFAGPVTLTWSPSGSGTSNTVSPGSTTTFTVTATDGSCTATDAVTVTVNSSPNATFTFNNNNSCAGTPVSFNSSVSGGQGPYSYSWNFGGAGNSAQANPTFTFNTTGSGTQNYTVTLTVTDNRGCSDTYSQTVSVLRLPDASFEDQDIFTPWVFCDGTGGTELFIDNTSTTTASNTNYHIDWGDGSTPYNAATLPNGISHNYSGQGYFNVVLTVTGSNGCTATMTQNVFVGGNPQIGLANPGGTVGICAEKQITFPITNFSNNPPGTTYTVTVNDGSAPVVFTHPPPTSYTHTFTTTSCGKTSLGGFANAFHVRIIAENPCGTTSALVEPIRLGSPPEADYTFTPPPDICVGDPVVFTSVAEGFFNNNGVCVDALIGGWDITPASGWSVVTGSLNSPDPITLNFSQPGNYDVRLIASNPCGSDTTIKPVCVAEPPNANFTTSSTSGCAPFTLPTTNTSNTVNSCANTIYAWVVTFNGSLCSPGTSGWSFQSGSPTSQSPTFSFTNSGTYSIILTITNNCGISTASQTITVETVPEVAIDPIPSSCAGNTINPSAVVLSTCYGSLQGLSWSFPGGSPSSSTSANPGQITYNNTGTYTVSFSASNGCGTSTASTSFNISQPPSVPIFSSNSPVCEGQTITINANQINGVTYQWTGPGSFSSGQQNVTINNATPSDAGTYTLVVTDGLGCSNTASINIVVNPLPVVTVNTPSPVCLGESVQLTADGATTYDWSPSNGLNTTTGNTVTANPTSTTTYTVTGTDGNGCSNTATIIVTINQLPNISVTQPPPICDGESTILTATDGVSYSWSPPTGLSATTGSVVTAEPDSTTTYTVVGTDANGCTDSATTTITVNPLPNVSVNQPSPICQGSSVTLTASEAATYTWSPPGGLSATFGPTVTASPNSTSTYTVTGTSAQGCQNTAQAVVNINPLPVVNVNSGTICAGNSLTLNAGGASTYNWSPATGLSATTGNSVTATPTNTMTYTVTGTDGNGCINTADAFVTINPLPNVDAGPDQQLCDQNIPVQLTGINPANGGTWSGNGVSTGGSFNPSTAGTGTHTLTYSYTDGNGCSNSDVVDITVIIPTTPDAGNDFTVCRDATIIDLNVQNTPTPTGGTWSGTGVSGNNFNPANATIGPNTFTYSYGTGTCLTTDDIVITVNDLPPVTVNSPTICAGNSTTLTAGGANNYSWAPATELNATTGASVTATPSGTTNYTLTGTDGNGCVNTATATVTVNPLPNVDAGPDQTFCEQNTTIQLVGTPANGTWSGTGTNAAGVFNPATAGIGIHQITYDFTDGNGCSNTDVTEITVDALPVLSIGNDLALCRDAGVVDLNAQNNPSPSGGTWSGTGVSGNNFNPASGSVGPNTITYSYGTGTCLVTDDIVITVNPLPVVSVNSETICAGDSVILNAGGANTYAWTPATGLSATSGSTVNAFPITTTTYTVTGTDGNNCVNTQNATVTVNPLPIVDAGPDQTFCDQNIPVQLTGTTPANGGTWSGNGVSPTGSFNPSGAGVGSHKLFYTFTDGNNCTNDDSVIVSVIVADSADAGSDFPVCVDAAPIDLDVQNNPDPANGTWNGSGVSNNIFTAANAVIGLNTIVYSIGTGTCLVTDTIEITVNDLPTISVNSPTICEEDSIMLTASGADTYTWNPTTDLSSSTGATVTAFPKTTTSYTVQGTDANSCVNVNTAVVTVNPLPTVDAGADQTFCDQNIPVQLTGTTPANGGTWSGNGVSPTGSFNPSGAGVGSHKLFYTFTDGNNCTNDDSVIVSVIVADSADAGSDFPVCVDAAPIDLDVQNNPDPANGTWNGSGVSNNIFTAANAVIGLNTIVYSIGTGTCLVTDTIEITVNDLPTISVNSPTICEEDSIMLTASGADTYTWNPTTDLSSSTGATVTAFPKTTTSYTVQGTDANSCVNVNTAVVTVNPLPTVDAGADQTFCDQNIPVQLTGTIPTNGGTWSGNGVSPTGSFNPSSAGTGSHKLYYSYTEGNTTCSNIDSVTIIVNDADTINAGNDFPVCVDAAPIDLTLQNNPYPLNGTWSGPGVVNNLFTAASASIGQNKLIYSSGSGTCLVQDSIFVTVNDLPNITVNSPSICENDSVTLTASGAATYTWSPNTTLSDSAGNQVIAFPTTNQDYLVRGTDTNSCINTNTASVSVNLLPTVEAGPDISTCNQPQFPTQLNGNSPGIGTWSGNFISSSGLFTPSGNEADTGKHVMTYSFTDGVGCTNNDTTTVTVISPTMPDAGNDFPLCRDAQAVDLNAQNNPNPGGGTWTGNGVNVTSFNPGVADTGIHMIIYSIGSGTCLVKDTIQATVNPLPIVEVNSGTICQDSFITLTCTGADTYSWSPLTFLTITGSSTADAFPPTSTTYTVTGTDTNGCANTAQAFVTVNPLPVVNAGPDTSTCNQPQFPTQLTGNPGQGFWTGSFISQSGLFTPSGNPGDTGTYAATYSFTDHNGCSNADTTMVTVVTPIFADAGPDRSVCYNDAPATLTGFSPTTGGVWLGAGIANSATGMFDPSIAGVGNIKLYYHYGSGNCATRDSVEITVNPPPTPDFTHNTTCINKTTSFADQSIANAGSLTSWQWNFGNGNVSADPNPSFTFAPVGNFTVSLEVSNSVGCSNDTTFTVTVHPLPTVTFTHDSMVCPDSAFQIHLTVVDALNYYWDFGDSTTGTGPNPIHAYDTVGRYEIKLVAETQYGCMDSSTSQIHVPEPPVSEFTFNPKTGCAPLDVSFYPFLPPDWTGLNYMWVFGNGITTFDPIPPTRVTYQAASDGGDTSYVVQLFVFSHTCQNFGVFTDTVKIISEPDAEITATFDPGCGYTDAEFTNPVNTVFDSVHVNYGDGNSEIVSTSNLYFNHTFYSNSGSDTTFIATYSASGANCNSEPKQIPVDVAPNTVKARFNLNPDNICLGNEFVLTSEATGGSYFYYDLGKGVSTVSNASTKIEFTFSDSGQYMIYQYVYSDDSCSFGIDSAIAVVNPSPISDFEYELPEPDCSGAEVVFHSTSFGSVKNIWNFGDQTLAAEADAPAHTYSEQGIYEVILISENEYGCTDSAIQTINIDFLSKGLYVPNALSPEFGDPKVRKFKPAGQCLETYHLQIFNTWGELVWESKELTSEGNPAQGWDGRHMNTGALLQQDVYVWQIDAVFLNSSVWEGKDYENARTKKIGSVTLLR